MVGATLAAAFLGAIVAYIGSARQQRKQVERDAQVRREQAAYDARIRFEAAFAELLAAAQDVFIGIRTIRQAHERRTTLRYFVRVLAVVWHAIPKPTTWRDLIEYPAMRSAFGVALELDRENNEVQRMVVIDTANEVISAK